MKTSMNRMIVGIILVASGFVAAGRTAHSMPQDRAGQSTKATVALPTRLSDAEFWKLVSDISEPGGYFRITDNFTSNEREVGRVLHDAPRAQAYRRRLPRRRSRAEPVVHRGDPTRHGLRRRHPPPGRDAAPDVQGRVRAGEGSRGLHLAAVLEAEAGGPRRDDADPADLGGVPRGRHRRRAGDEESHA